MKPIFNLTSSIKKRLLSVLPLLLIIILALLLRLYGLNWDQNQHLHPDERFLTMVANAIKWPTNISEYLNTNQSPLNPHNMGHGFFVYGTFPLFLVKWVAESLKMEDYNHLTLVGRAISAFFDVGTVLLVFAIAKTLISKSKFLISKQIPNPKSQIPKKSKIGSLGIGTYSSQLEIGSIRNFPYLAAFFYAVSILPIQLSHFFAVDTFLTFFLTLSFYFLLKILAIQQTQSIKLKTQNSKLKATTQMSKLKKSFRAFRCGFDVCHLRFAFYSILLGTTYGLALSSKISALLFLPIIALGFLYMLIKSNLSYPKRILLLTSYFLLLSLSTYLTVRLAYPYLFTEGKIFTFQLNPKVIDNWKQLKSFDNPNANFPPAVQWIKTKPYIFPLKNMLLWGLGLPLGILSIFAVAYTIVTLLHYSIARLRKQKKQSNNYSNLGINSWLHGFMASWFRNRQWNNETMEQSDKEEVNGTAHLGIFLILLWIFLLFAYQGAQFSKTMRYFASIYPFLAIITAWFVSRILATKKPRWTSGLIGVGKGPYPVPTDTRILLIPLDKVFINLYKHLSIFTNHLSKPQTRRVGDLHPKPEGSHRVSVGSGTLPVHSPLISRLAYISLFFVLIIYPISFLTIYSRPHSRIAASAWIYANIPPGSTLATEHWDDGLPLNLNFRQNSSRYKSVSLPLYDPDTEEKWRKIIPLLEKTDYILLTSNRLYGSIMTVPERYPITYRYYQALFNGSLGFNKMAEFTSRPHIPFPFIHLCLTPPLARYGIIAKASQECPLSGISFVDDYADESFTVYDHPKVIIFKKDKNFNIITLQKLLFS